VSGSLERGKADCFSDVDLDIRVRDAHYAAIASTKAAFFDRLYPTVACVDAYHDDNFSTCACLFHNLVCGDMGIVRESFAPMPSKPASLEKQAWSIRRKFLVSAENVADALARRHLWLARDGVENHMRFQLFRLLDLFHGPSEPRWAGRRIEPLLRRLGLSERMQEAACSYASQSIGRAQAVLINIFDEHFGARFSTDEPSPSNAILHDGSTERRRPDKKSMLQLAHTFWYEVANNVRFAGRGEQWFARFNYESFVMEAILRLIEDATGSALGWQPRGHYSTVECIDKLPDGFPERLAAICQPDGIPFSWQRMHAAMELFTELSRQTGLMDHQGYPEEAGRSVSAYAEEVRAFTQQPT